VALGCAEAADALELAELDFGKLAEQPVTGATA
jgi:hypothetical protein